MIPAVAQRRATDPLAHALCAAELNEPFPADRLPIGYVRELFHAVPHLSATVPYATLQLLARLANDRRYEVRCGVANALPWLADLYPARVEALLRRLLPR
jgi:hypothetical protein